MALKQHGWQQFCSRLASDLKLLRTHSGPEQALRQQSRLRRSRLCLYSGLLFWGLLTGWILLNLLASRTPARLNIDASDDQLYSLSAASRDVLAALEQSGREVSIYALFSQGQRPTQPLDIYRYLELYAGPHVHIEEVDPALEPERIRPFITGVDKRGRGANKAPQRNSLIVFSRGEQPRFRVIHYSDLYYVMQHFGPRNPSIRAEQQISSAIAYVNGARVAQLGLLKGHREQSLGAIQAHFEQFNIAVRDVALATQGPEVLGDLDVLLIYQPQLDLSEAEYRQLSTYLERGAALWLVLDFQAEYLPRFYQLAADYGIEILEGVVLERDPRRIQAGSGDTRFVTPIRPLKSNEQEGLHPIVKPLRENKISDLLWSQSMALRESQLHPRALRFYTLVESSSASLLRSSRDPSSSIALEGDLNGPLTLMGLSVWQNEEGRRSGPAVLLSFDAPGPRSVFTEPGNLQLFYSALSWLGRSQQNGSEAGANGGLVFPGKSLLMLPLRLSVAQAISWAAIFVAVLPLGILLAGLLFLQRRKQL